MCILVAERKIFYSRWWWRKDPPETYYILPDMESRYSLGLVLSEYFFPLSMNSTLNIEFLKCRYSIFHSGKLPQFHFLWLCCSGQCDLNNANFYLIWWFYLHVFFQ